MKLKYKKCLNILNSTLNIKPSHTEISKIIGATANALSNRLSNDGYLKEDEINKIEKYYGISLNDENDFINIDYFPSELGRIVNKTLVESSTKEIISVPKKYLSEYSNTKKYFAMNTLGDSMTPTIFDKDKLIIEQWEKQQIKDNRIYIFSYENEIFIKRLVKNLDQIVVKSDNTIYPMRFIEKKDKEDFFIIGQIVGLIRDVC